MVTIINKQNGIANYSVPALQGAYLACGLLVTTPTKAKNLFLIKPRLKAPQFRPAKYYHLEFFNILYLVGRK